VGSGPTTAQTSETATADAAVQIIDWANRADELARSAGVDVKPVTDGVRGLLAADPSGAARELLSGNPAGGAPVLMARAEEVQAELHTALRQGGQAPAGDQVLPLRDEVREAFSQVSDIGAARATVTRLLADGADSPMASVLASRWADLHFENRGMPGISDLVHGELAAQRAGSPVADLLDHFSQAPGMGSAAASIARNRLDVAARAAQRREVASRPGARI
jgi:hypothetical protein